MRIVFMGTPEFAIPSLEALVENKYNVIAVVTQPDKPAGRGKRIVCSDIKCCAMKHNIEVLQPKRIKENEWVERLKAYQPDLFVTCAFGQILSQEILDIPKLGCINVHGSLLPKYRGAGTIHKAIIDGENETGITTMFTDAGVDTGDMLLKESIEITEDMTTGELHDKLKCLGAMVLIKTLKGLEEGTLVKIPQDNSQASYAPIIKKEIGEIDWSKTSTEIHNLVRGTYPWPIAYSHYDGDRMRVLQTTKLELKNTDMQPGTILQVEKEGIDIQTGDGIIRIKKIQFDNCRPLLISQFICGHEIVVGHMLGKG